jgi:hypothetical protein
VSWFRDQAQAILVLSRGVPASMAAQIVERIKQIGDRAVTLAQAAADHLSRTLQEAAGRLS